MAGPLNRNRRSIGYDFRVIRYQGDRWFLIEERFLGHKCN